MSYRSFLIAVTLVGVTACGTGDQHAAPATSTTAPPTTTTTSAAPEKSFSASANDLLTALNMQLPILHDGAKPLPTSAQPGGIFGGRVSPNVEIYIRPESNAFSKVRAVTVHVTGSGGAVQAPARLLSGVGTSLYALSPDAIDAFRTEALPRLSTVTQPRTTVTVKQFYDLTIVVRDSSTLAFVYTPVGVAPLASYEAMGK